MGTTLSKTENNYDKDTKRHEITNTTLGNYVTNVIESIEENQKRACCSQIYINDDGEKIEDKPLFFKFMDFNEDEDETCKIHKNDYSKATLEMSKGKLKVNNAPKTFVDNPEQCKNTLKQVKKAVYFKTINNYVNGDQGKLKDVCTFVLPSDKTRTKQEWKPIDPDTCDPFYKNFCSKRLTSNNCFDDSDPKKPKLNINHPKKPGQSTADIKKGCVIQPGMHDSAYDGALNIVEDECGCLNAPSGYTLNTKKNKDKFTDKYTYNIFQTPKDYQHPEILDQMCFDTLNTHNASLANPFSSPYKLKAYRKDELGGTFCMNNINVNDIYANADDVGDASLEVALKNIKQTNNCGQTTFTRDKKEDTNKKTTGDPDTRNNGESNIDVKIEIEKEIPELTNIEQKAEKLVAYNENISEVEEQIKKINDIISEKETALEELQRFDYGDDEEEDEQEQDSIIADAKKDLESVVKEKDTLETKLLKLKQKKSIVEDAEIEKPEDEIKKQNQNKPINQIDTSKVKKSSSLTSQDLTFVASRLKNYRYSSQNEIFINKTLSKINHSLESFSQLSEQEISNNLNRLSSDEFDKIKSIQPEGKKNTLKIGDFEFSLFKVVLMIISLTIGFSIYYFFLKDSGVSPSTTVPVTS